eukprot:scaffold991_cov128-Cylindrotheca_fusiformis.AAC.6
MKKKAYSNHMILFHSTIDPEETRIKIDDTIKKIPHSAFYAHSSLMEVTLPKLLKVIGAEAFRDCEALRRVIVPDSVVEIEYGAFNGCTSLQYVHIPAGINKISEELFAHSGLKTVAIPWTVVVIEKSAFAYCDDLLSVELPKGLRRIGEQAFLSCESLVNIEIPPSVNRLGDKAFEWCMSHIALQFGVNIERLERRFEGLPVHKVCYYQTNYSEAGKHKRLMKAISHGADPDTASTKLGLFACMQKPAAPMFHDVTQFGHFVDPFGMTPLHLLCLSARPSLQVFGMLLNTYPSDVIHCDEHGNTPLAYVCKLGGPVILAERLLNTQRSFFPDIALGLEYYSAIANHCDSRDLLVFFTKLATSYRLNCLGLKKWKKDILAMIGELGSLPSADVREAYIAQINRKLAFYEHKEILSLLELALWRSAMLAALRAEGDVYSRTTKISNRTARRNFRINCGSEIVISNILPFLAGGDATFVDIAVQGLLSLLRGPVGGVEESYPIDSARAASACTRSEHYPVSTGYSTQSAPGIGCTYQVESSAVKAGQPINPEVKSRTETKSEVTDVIWQL